MDGVLVDSEEFYQQRREDFLVEKGLTLKGIPMKKIVGGTFNTVADFLGLDNKKTIEFSEKYTEYKKQHPIFYPPLLNPEARKVLINLKQQKIKIGLASSSNRIDIDRMLSDCQLRDFFDILVSGEEFVETKPNPEIYLYTVQKLGLPVKECLAIEDSEIGIQAAKSAGVTVFALKDKSMV